MREAMIKQELRVSSPLCQACLEECRLKPLLDSCILRFLDIAGAAHLLLMSDK